MAQMSKLGQTLHWKRQLVRRPFSGASHKHEVGSGLRRRPAALRHLRRSGEGYCCLKTWSAIVWLVLLGWLGRVINQYPKGLKDTGQAPM